MRRTMLLTCCALAACADQEPRIIAAPAADGVFVATGRGAPNSTGILIAQFTAMESGNRTCEAQRRRFVPIADAVTPGGSHNTYAVRFACVDERDMAPAANRIVPPAPPL